MKTTIRNNRAKAGIIRAFAIISICGSITACGGNVTSASGTVQAQGTVSVTTEETDPNHCAAAVPTPDAMDIKKGDLITADMAREWLTDPWHRQLYAIKKGDAFEVVHLDGGSGDIRHSVRVHWREGLSGRTYGFMDDRFHQTMDAGAGDMLVAFVDENHTFTRPTYHPVLAVVKTLPAMVLAVIQDMEYQYSDMYDVDDMPVGDFLVSGDAWKLRLEEINGEPVWDAMCGKGTKGYLTKYCEGPYGDSGLYLYSDFDEDIITVGGYAGSEYKEVELLSTNLVWLAKPGTNPEFDFDDGSWGEKRDYISCEYEYTKDGYIIVGRPEDILAKGMTSFVFAWGNLISIVN